MEHMMSSKTAVTCRGNKEHLPMRGFRQHQRTLGVVASGSLCTAAEMLPAVTGVACATVALSASPLQCLLGSHFVSVLPTR
eukprot:2882845-Pleurochrysis_carterae.AAC.1